jgi:hypothetical protein
MKEINYRKDYKNIYLPGKKPCIIDLPSLNYVTVEFEGDPNREEFSELIEALYSFSYTVKMSYKSERIPENYYKYTVFPLEGEWDVLNKSVGNKDKNNFKAKMMMRQPDFLNEELFDYFLKRVKNKKCDNKFVEKLKFEFIDEGLCCQIMHIGIYDEEYKSFEVMDDFCSKNDFFRIDKRHKEIYISDPRRTEVSKLKTVLRYKIAKKKMHYNYNASFF